MNRMLTYSFVAAALLAAIFTAGCGGRDQNPAPSAQGEAAVATPPTEGSGSHAEGIVPGSHADWCAEHGVPETSCTRCDASLIAAFKATGDWCEEHGLPKSQCLACDPTIKIARAPKPEGGE